MPWPPDIAGDLPAPRDDEPDSLRQDIADELADHLQSSFTRELHFTPEESSAKHKVLDRFGDPRRVARQLWFDAMKEKIMSQRVLIGALVVTAVACLGSTGLMWMLVDQTRLANQALVEQVEQSRKANETMLEQSRATNAALLDKLSGLALSPVGTGEPVKSMEWNSVRFRLVKDATGGRPAAGFTVSLNGYLLDTAKEIELRRLTGPDGIADLGLVRPGQHPLSVSTPWNEARSTATLTVLPGQSIMDEIVCPGAERELTTASLSVEWPEELRAKHFWIVAHLSQTGREITGERWSGPSKLRDHLVIVDGEGVAVPFAMGDGWGLAGGLFHDPFDFRSSDQGTTAFGAFTDAAWYQSQRRKGAPNWQDLRPFHFRYAPDLVVSNKTWPVGRYVMRDILVAGGPSKTETGELRTLDILGGLVTDLSNNLLPGGTQEQFIGATKLMSPITDWAHVGPREGGERQFRPSPQLREQAQPVFELKSQVVSPINIPIPPLLIENVLNFLEATK